MRTQPGRRVVLALRGIAGRARDLKRAHAVRWTAGVIAAAVVGAIVVGGRPWWWPEDAPAGVPPELTGASASPHPGSEPLELDTRLSLVCPFTSGWVLPGWQGSTPRLARLPPNWEPPRSGSGRRLITGEPLDPWLKAHNAVATGGTWVNVGLRGTSTKAVRIDDIQVTVLERRPMARGAKTIDICGGTVITAYRAEVTLDDLPVGEPVSLPAVSAQVGDVASATTKTINLPFSVSESDLAEIAVWAKARDHEHDWVFDILWTDGARHGKTRVTAGDGRPFRLSGTPE